MRYPASAKPRARRAWISSRRAGPTRSSASSASTQSWPAARVAKARWATNPGQGAFTINLAPAASATARVPSVEPESTTTISSQNATLARASPIVFSSFCAIRTAESGTMRPGV